MKPQPEQVFRFGPYRLDARRRVLTREGVPLQVTPKALELLVFLIERRGTVVEKEEILRGLWPHVAVEEGNITVNVSQLRRALGESKTDHRFILTVPGRGYQFVAPVQAEEGLNDVAVRRPLSAGQRPLLTRRPSQRALTFAVLLTCLVAGLVAVVPGLWWTDAETTYAEGQEAEARALYVRGRFFLNKRTAEGLERALDLFDQAIRHSPRFAAAHAGRADAYSLLGYFGFAAPTDTFLLAEAAAREALRLDPELAAAHTSLAYVSHRFHWDWTAAEAGFRRAIQLDPEYAAARHWYAAFLEGMGREDEALLEARRAQTLDPLALVVGANLGTMLGTVSRLEESVEQAGRLLEMDPTFWPARWTLARAYASRGDLEGAAREFEAAARLSGRAPYLLSELGEFYARSGRPEDAAAVLHELEVRAGQQYIPAYFLALIHAALGDADRAFQNLERAYEERSPNLAFLNVRRNFERLRPDHRFGDLVRRIGLPDRDAFASSIGPRSPGSR